MNSTLEATGYYPAPESAGGWRQATDPDIARELADIDLAALTPGRAWNAAFEAASAVVIVRRGYLVAEWYEHGSDPQTRFNVHSCTKSFTGTAYGILFDGVRRGLWPDIKHLGLESAAYDLIPWGQPLTDPRKADIRFRHLLSMTSGIPGEDHGIYGCLTAPDVNAFEAALGHKPLRRNPARDKTVPEELWTSKLAAEPGAVWEYSDPAFAHLGLAFQHITGQGVADFMRERVLDPIGIEALAWNELGLDDGNVGRHPNPYSGIHVAAREFARFGYLMARGGVWQRQQLVAPWWTEMATVSSQADNPRYGLTWWVNTDGVLWDGVPHDAFAAIGYNTNFCCVMPSLDLVVARIGDGPAIAPEPYGTPLLAAVARAVVDA